jgi:hypothetical protein
MLFLPSRRWMAGYFRIRNQSFLFVKPILTTLQTLPVLSRGDYYELSYAIWIGSKGKIAPFYVTQKQILVMT